MPQEKNPKSTKKEFAYIEPKDGNPICGRCRAYYDKKCTNVYGTINPKNGSCILWEERRTKPDSKERYHPVYTKNDAKYLETPKGPRCGTCKFYTAPRRCNLVEGDIDPIKGCCIAWEKERD